MARKKDKEKGIGFLGSDVSKGMCDFTLESETGDCIENNFQLDDNHQGHQKLYELLKRFSQQHGLKKIVIGVESTGGYENNWYNGLRRKSKALELEVFRINPKRIYHATKADGERSITDKVSARVIAGFLRKNYGKKSLAPERLETAENSTATFSNMKNLHKYIQRLVSQSTQTKNALEKLLYSTMPELLSIKGDKYRNWFLELLIQYPSREAILSADNEEIIKIPYLTQSKLNEINLALEESVGKDEDKYTSIAIREQARDIQQFQNKIAGLKKELIDLAKQENQFEEDIDLLTSINGIGEDTAIGYLIEIGQVSRFEKGKNLVAFWGINPTIKQSGDKNSYIGMSKEGSSSARAIMYLAAKNAIKNEAYFNNIYHQQRKKGKPHYSAMGIVMAKLTRVMYGILKSRKKFESTIDIENKEKIRSKDSKKQNNKKTSSKTSKGVRRYQDKQNTAPVSMTQRVKRKQEKQEQNVPS